MFDIGPIIWLFCRITEIHCKELCTAEDICGLLDASLTASPIGQDSDKSDRVILNDPKAGNTEDSTSKHEDNIRQCNSFVSNHFASMALAHAEPNTEVTAVYFHWYITLMEAMKCLRGCGAEFIFRG